ncbi:MAG: hypothetical protein J6A98_02835 [Clostridia bacterium]|nr:hypothetical protein [Clostridia bacterium]
MKRFFMCCVVVIVALFLGFTAYYFIANKENITLASEHSSAIKLNVNDTINMDDIIVHTLPSSGTFIDVKFSIDGIISYDKETKTFTAEKVGDTVVTLTPSNAKFGPFVLSANVGDGRSAEYPYYIRTADELASIGASGSALTTGMSYELIADIYLSNRAWTPIASGIDAGFTGTFDGANHVIYDMKVSGGAGSAGMFAKVAKGASVERITFVNASVAGDYTYAGIVAGQNSGTISLCQVLESSITNGNGATGGIVGWNNFTQQENGGLSARIGMCGVEKSSITAGGDVGGIAGANTASIIENCYVVLNAVNGNGTAKFGGIVGNNAGYNGSFDKVSTIYKSYAYVPSAAEVAQASGIAAINTDASSGAKNTFVYNIFAMETSNYVGTTTSATSSDIVKKSAADLKTPDTYTAWDFNRVWKMDENYAVVNFESTYSTNISESIIFVENIYPTTPEVPGTGGNGGGSGSGSGSGSSSPIIIPGTSKTNLTSQSDVWAMLKTMSEKPNGTKAYTIAANITVDLSQASTYGVSFPLGTKETPFTYQLYPTSSQRITFKNLNVSGVDYASFFGYMGTGATVSGLIFKDAAITGNATVASGVVAAYLESGVTLANCTVTNSALTASGNNAGFIAGASKGSLVGNSVENSTMTTTGNVYGGAIVGSNASAVLKASVSETAIVANGIGHFGGVAGHSTGYVDSSTVSGLALTATNANVQAGGLIGHSTGSASGNLVKDSTITASTTQTSAYAGGLVGVNSGKINKNSFLNSAVTGYYVGGVSALNSGSIQRTTAGQNHLGKVSGIYAGGLVSINQSNGFIDNCLVGLQMVTIEGSDKTCGFAYKLEADSLISHSFSYAKFYDNYGEQFCDTATAFRSFWANTIVGGILNQPMGKIENSLFCNVSNTHIYGEGIVPDAWDDKVKNIQVTEAEAKGSNNWMKFYENGFALSSIWKRTQGQWLSLQ